jgi:predicted site-specific integrase-resolvase
MRTYSTVPLVKHLGISRQTIYRWMRTGKITGVRVSRVGNIQVRLWTNQDAANIKKLMKENYGKGRGRQPKPKSV